MHNVAFKSNMAAQNISSKVMHHMHTQPGATLVSPSGEEEVKELFPNYLHCFYLDLKWLHNHLYSLSTTRKFSLTDEQLIHPGVADKFPAKDKSVMITTSQFLLA